MLTYTDHCLLCFCRIYWVKQGYARLQFGDDCSKQGLQVKEEVV